MLLKRRLERNLKKMVKEQMYPRDSTLTLWQLIARYHQLEFTNLKKLAQLAITLPVHTADVERGFSTQNLILTSQRNRLTAENQAMLMRVQMEGPSDVKGESEWVFRVTEKWGEKRKRMLFNQKDDSK